MTKPDFKEIAEDLRTHAKNLQDNARIGESKIVLAVAEMIPVFEWSSSQQDTNNIQIANLTEEIKTLKGITAENSVSSKRVARWSLVLAVVAIFVSLVIGGVQIYLAKIQVDPILEQEYRTEKNAYDFCKEPGDWDIKDGGSTLGSTCKETYLKLREKFGTYPPAESAPSPKG